MPEKFKQEKGINSTSIDLLMAGNTQNVSPKCRNLG